MWPRTRKALKKDFQVKSYLWFQLTCLKLAGMWPMELDKALPKPLKKFGRPIELVYLVFTYGNFLHSEICQLKTLYDNRGGTVDEIYLYIQNGLVFFTSLVHILSFRYYHKEIKALFDWIETTFRNRSAPGAFYVTVQSSYEYARKFQFIWEFIVLLSTFSFSIDALFAKERILPAQTWYPFDAYKSPQYEIIFFCQSIGWIQIGIVYSTFFALFLSINMLFCGQFDILYCSLKNVKATGLIKTGIPSCLELVKQQQKCDFPQEASEYYCSVEQKEDLEQFHSTLHGYGPDFAQLVDQKILEAISDCIRFHQTMLEACKKSKFALSFNLLATIGHMTLIGCLFTYSLSMTQNFSKAVNYAVYMGFCYYQILMLCYSSCMVGNQVRNRKLLE